MPPKSNKKNGKGNKDKVDKKNKKGSKVVITKIAKAPKSSKAPKPSKKVEIDIESESGSDYDNESETELSEMVENSESSDMDYGADDSEGSEEGVLVLEDILDIREKDKSERIIITGDERVMSDRLTHYELTTVICFREAQIEAGSPKFTGIIANNPRGFAIAELRERRCTLKVLRHSHDNYYEEWKVNEMLIPLNSSSIMQKK